MINCPSRRASPQDHLRRARGWRAPRRVFGTLLSLEPAVAVLAGLVLLGQHVPAVAARAIALVITASAGATLGARPPAAATGGAG